MSEAVLALEDGTIFKGRGFGYPSEVSGEVVFNTGMVGYTESLTDPSYNGQILTQTWILIGNYGVPPTSLVDKFNFPLHFESERIQVKGYVVQELVRKPSHWSNNKSLDEWLSEQKIPGIEGIDTRELTKKLRIKGVMLGILKVAEKIDVEEIKEKVKRIEDPNKRDLVKEVSIEKPIEYKNASSTVVLVDCGVKFGILRNLAARGVDIVRVPYDYPAEKILEYKPSGIIISNGPGDPKKCEKTIQTVKELMETDLPMMGICLGCQILALAAGADTFKLKFGHRGSNHPAFDLFGKKCYITSQNHGYAVDPESLKETDFEIWFINANDKTVEGIKHKRKPIFATQFHPEASPGPYETEFLFDLFVKEVKRYKG
ncbi:MAG: glutamine-hydrolyzing carbamoyl-phosphate synthase small subunit [Candidatus Aenigmatarchaeota archaeon]